MTKRKLESNPSDRRIDAVIARKREPNPDAASRLSIEKARVGNELSADPLPYDESESAEALKRTAEPRKPRKGTSTRF